MTSQPGKQTITVHILHNIWKSKGDKTMTFGHIVDCNVRNNFLQKLCRKWGRETSSRPVCFLKKLYME